MERGKSFLKCSVAVERFSPESGSVLARVNYNASTIRLIQNDSREIFLEISNKNTRHRLTLNNINVFKRFTNEGKACIRFQQEYCTIFISNAPPAYLILFLSNIFVNMIAHFDRVTQKTLWKQTVPPKLLCGKSQTSDDISSVTVEDVTTPTPSKKHKPDDALRDPAPKNLYGPSHLTSALNTEQQQVLNACVSGKNIFFTGSAGTGKSFLLKRIIASLPPDDTVSTASTGVAACLIGGTTLHAFAGIGDGTASLGMLCEKALSAARNWRKCKHLIIDEISMVHASYFEKLEAIARFVCNNEKPFGGIQLILCGDFFQLPPVEKKKSGKRFCFQADCWEKCIELYFELSEVHRQTDPEFISILNNIRIGRVTEDISKRLMKTASQIIETDGIQATRLCSLTNECEKINNAKLKSLNGEETLFSAIDSDNATATLDSKTNAPSKLILKVGAQVMLLRNINIPAGLVNGAKGVVVRFEEGFPVVRFKNKKEYTAKRECWYVKTEDGFTLHRYQVPLNLAWAFTIHKSQGLTLNCVEMSLGTIFEAGQAYVALSRAQSLDTIRVLNFRASVVKVDPDVLKFHQRFQRSLQQMEYIPLGIPLSRMINKKSKLKAILENILKKK